LDLISERRSGQRARRLFKVEFLLECVEVKATVTDISRVGAFLHSKLLPKMGTSVEFAVSPIKPNASTVMVTGEVVRVVSREPGPGEVRGFGVKWRNMNSSGGPTAIAELFYDMCGEHLSPELPRTKEPTSVEYSFDEDQFQDRDVTLPEYRIENRERLRPPETKTELHEETVQEQVTESALESYKVRLAARIASKEARLAGLVTKLGPESVEIQTASGSLQVSSMVTVQVENRSASWSKLPGIRILGRVVSSYSIDTGGVSELRISMVDERGVMGAFELLLDDARDGRLE